MENPAARNQDFNLSTLGFDNRARAAARPSEDGCPATAPFRYVSDPAYEHDVQHRVPAVGEGRRVLGSTATTSLDEMLDEVVPWIENALAVGAI